MWDARWFRVLSLFAAGTGCGEDEPRCSDTSGACIPAIWIVLDDQAAKIATIAGSSACGRCEPWTGCWDVRVGECTVTVTTTDGRTGTGSVTIEGVREDECCGRYPNPASNGITIELPPLAAAGAGGSG